MSAEIIICVCYNCPLVEPKSNSPPLIPKYRRPSCTICYSPPANYHIVRLSLSLSNAKRRFHPILSPHLHIICFITFMDISNTNFIFGKFYKNLGFVQPPTPLSWLRQNPDFFSKNFELGAPLRLSAREETKSHRLHLFDFSPLCISKRLLKLAAIEDEKSHWLHFFTFLHCAFLNVSSNCLPERMKSHIGCICLTFLHCVFSNVSSKELCDKRRSRIGNI